MCGHMSNLKQVTHINYILLTLLDISKNDRMKPLYATSDAVYTYFVIVTITSRTRTFIMDAACIIFLIMY